MKQHPAVTSETLMSTHEYWPMKCPKMGPDVDWYAAAEAADQLAQCFTSAKSRGLVDVQLCVSLLQADQSHGQGAF